MTTKAHADGALERPLPRSEETERAVLGAILLDNGALPIVRYILTPDDFFIEQHRRIFEIFIEMADAQQPIDLVTLTEKLDEHGKLEAAGGSAFLTQLMDGLPLATAALNVGTYAEVVKGKASLRRAIFLADALKDAAFEGRIDSDKLVEIAALKNGLGDSWRSMFHAAEDFKNAPSLRFAIDGFLQLDGATLFGGLAGHGKTFVMLSVVKALLTGKKLFGHFEVREMAARVLYLIPESTIGPFGHRLKLFGLEPYLETDRLLVRTLSMGVTPCLGDPRILAAAKGSDVFLDTAVRFAEGDENSASDNQRGLASDIFALLGAGARQVTGAHHSAKAFGQQTAITLENVLRGSGDVGAMVTTCYGLKQIDALQNVIHVECVKGRDLQPVEPFQIVGRPYIDTDGDFRMHKEPGRCGRLADEQPEINRGGAPMETREERSRRVEMVRKWLAENPGMTAKGVCENFKKIGIPVSESAAKNYRKESMNRGDE